MILRILISFHRSSKFRPAMKPDLKAEFPSSLVNRIDRCVKAAQDFHR